MVAKGIKRKIRTALENIQKEINGNASGGFYARGLAGEGYAGGYRDALYAVQALLNGNRPPDDRCYWKGRQ
jgi:hypothetical protein